MKISGGAVRGRTLKFPSRSIQRPTTDFLREALFNLLGSPADQGFLDLFAGSGAVGLEAASRGAKRIVFVEKSKTLIGFIRQNVALCGYTENSQIILADIKSAVPGLCRKKSDFDVVFADPPYNIGLIGETLRLLTEYPILRKGGLLIFQHSVREQLTGLPDGWQVADQRKYGDNLLTFIRWAAHD